MLVFNDTGTKLVLASNDGIVCGDTFIELPLRLLTLSLILLHVDIYPEPVDPEVNDKQELLSADGELEIDVRRFLNGIPYGSLNLCSNKFGLGTKISDNLLKLNFVSDSKTESLALGESISLLKIGAAGDN